MATSRSTARPARRGVPAWLRVLIPAVLILGWLAAAGIGGPTFGRLSTVVSNDQTSFLPASAESTEVQALLPSQEPLNPRQLGTVSNFFEVHGRLRLLDRVLEERSLVQRKGRDVNVLQHERVSVSIPSAI